MKTAPLRCFQAAFLICHDSLIPEVSFLYSGHLLSDLSCFSSRVSAGGGCRQRTPVHTLTDMRIDIIQIGNSRGIRIPSLVLKECGIAEQVELEIQEGKIVLYPISKPRTGWEKSFRDMHAEGDDRPLLPEDVAEPEEDWQW